jgi:hypothetical protein
LGIPIEMARRINSTMVLSIIIKVLLWYSTAEASIFSLRRSENELVPKGAVFPSIIFSLTP